jgi:hypothetical protein
MSSTDSKGSVEIFRQKKQNYVHGYYYLLTEEPSASWFKEWMPKKSAVSVEEILQNYPNLDPELQNSICYDMANVFCQKLSNSVREKTMTLEECIKTRQGWYLKEYNKMNLVDKDSEWKFIKRDIKIIKKAQIELIGGAKRKTRRKHNLNKNRRKTKHINKFNRKRKTKRFIKNKRRFTKKR